MLMFHQLWVLLIAISYSCVIADFRLKNQRDAPVNPPAFPSNVTMKKTFTPFTAQLVTFDTTLPVETVISRLDAAVNKTGSAQFLPQFRTATSKDEITKVINDITGANDFLYFLEMNHGRWLTVYDGTAYPTAAVYTIGNPLTAQTILRHDIRAGYNIPPRLLIIEKADKTGTNVIYHLPSSVMVLNDNPNLKAAAEALDDMVDRMITNVTSDA